MAEVLEFVKESLFLDQLIDAREGGQAFQMILLVRSTTVLNPEWTPQLVGIEGSSLYEILVPRSYRRRVPTGSSSWEEA